MDESNTGNTSFLSLRVAGRAEIMRDLLLRLCENPIQIRYLVIDR